PFRTRGDTRQGTNTYSRYSCAPNTNESGPELVYTIEATVPGVIAAQLSNLPAGVDVDVHIVVGDTCVSRGNWSASAYVPAGRHRIIVDSWVDSAGRVRSGAFDLLVGYTQPTDLAEAGLTTVAADRALVAFAQAWEQGATDRFVYTIVDLDQPSNQPRLVAWDLLNQAVVTRAYVGHGVGSTMEDDPARVVSVGDDLERSPVGLLLTGERTQGPDGIGIQLDGIEPGFNDNARARSLQLISDYSATADFVNAHGAPALTQGDLTVAPDVLARLSEAVGDGALVILHFSDAAWLDTSDYLEP
ncbi:MAG: murein L,D-transpeptidase catalytic domain family protein, partial [Myxococcales bacterium]|nr:murein L,D-transpeptidase catalytic domain family protein [Myxococcales bacterium]